MTGTGNYAALLPETLAPLNSPENRCSVVGGVPNRNMSLSMPHLAHLIIPFSGEIRMAA
jgi:hypothetical protein